MSGSSQISLVERAIQETESVLGKSPLVGHRRADPVRGKLDSSDKIPSVKFTTFKLNFGEIARKGFLSPAQFRSNLGKQTASIKRSLIHRLEIYKRSHENANSATKRVRNSILITSPNENDGKSFVAINLAIDLVFDSKMQVVIIDSDLKKGAISTSLGIDVEIGLVDLVNRKIIEWNSCIIKEESSDLFFIPVGYVANSRDAGGHDAINVIAKVINDVKVAFPQAIVLVDAPPLLATVEASALAECVDETIIVVDSERSDPAQVGSAIDSLRRTENVSLVLNKVRMPVAASSYYDG